MSISTVTSEALQLKIRQLLPSQQGFGTDLSAQDTIVPIIDLTAAAGGSEVPEYLQTALAFGSQTAFNTSNTTTLLTNTTGFFRIVGTSCMRSDNGATNSGFIQMTDGVTTKDVWRLTAPDTTSDQNYTADFDIIVFLTAGDSVSAISDSPKAFISGSIRQVATSSGELVQPVGFNPQ
jgi:hypothetical protein